jgi:hypothetical protein
MSYTIYTDVAADMQELVNGTQERLDCLSSKVFTLDSELDSMVTTVHTLSALPSTRSQLNSYLLNTYNPAALALATRIQQRDSCGKTLEQMKAAMLEPQFLRDFETQSAQRLVEEMQDMLIAEVQTEEGLIAEAVPGINESFVRSTIGAMRLYPNDCMEKPAVFEEGSLGTVSINTSGRTWAIDWFTPAIVLKRAMIPGVGRVCVVCHIDESYEGNIVVRIVEEDSMRGPPKDGRMVD